MKSKRFYVVKKPLTKSGSSSVKLINILQGDALLLWLDLYPRLVLLKRITKTKLKRNKQTKTV